ncbi:glycerol-3-phosphate acyltransferase 2, mitochondrial isoform X7 [Oncorhynchus mykiss]|uniref:glycerol-3-phosphate acyltransferase 2, mitochondrial isoform X7 n=1 Tax=Oncorhynchus mykiss TaxID=8022 RepID=UPI0018775FBB|nr:glycerol-3-phosphate acyltransferase 2, mitochondrial isoform X7 [Oncorhynchus mykiss]
MAQESGYGFTEALISQGTQQKRPALSWGSKIKKKLKTVAPYLGKFRPSVGQCCHQCTPDSLGKKLGQTIPSLGFHNLLSVNETHTRLVGWVLLKVFGSVFCSVQVNLNHMAPLHRASKQGASLVYVCVPQSIVDYALIPLVLFCHNLRVPYTLCHLQTHNNWFRSVLQRLGVVLLPPDPITEQEAETDNLYSSVMTSLVGELLCEGQVLSVCVSGESWRGGQWLARIRLAVREGVVPDVHLVPVGISYDCVPNTSTPVGLLSTLRCVFSLLCGNRQRSSVRIHFAQPFSLKEMCDTGKCRVDGGRPLQDLLLPTILHNRSDAIFGQRTMSWILPPRYLPELCQSERDLSIALTLHLTYSTMSCMAVMSTSLVSCLLLHKHRKGVCLSVLCRDVAWLLEEILFRNRDVGFGGSLVGVVYHSLTLLTPHLTLAAHPKDRSDPLIAPHPSLSATLSLSRHSQILTHTFIHEAVGACAVSAMLCEVAGCGGSSRIRGEEIKGDEVRGEMEFDVALCQDELTERALQLTHLLPPGYIPPCQSSHGFALDAVDTLVRCGILVMEEVKSASHTNVPSDTPICDFWRKGALTWSASDDHSDCEEGEARSFKLSQPSQCPELLFFLCSLMAGYLRALCWATKGLDLLDTPLPEAVCLGQIHSHLCYTAQRDRGHYESCSEEVARVTVRTLTDLGVLVEDQQRGCVFLGVSPLFQQTDNRQKLHSFVSQFLYD